jgi:uncharacterized protein DUF2190
MARQENIRCLSIEAGGDLSAGQFRFVEVASDGQVDLVAAEGGDAIGVLQNNPAAAGRAATVAYEGVVKVVVGTGGLTAGQKCKSDAAGAAVLATAASSDHVLGKVLVGAAAGGLAEILLRSSTILA